MTPEQTPNPNPTATSEDANASKAEEVSKIDEKKSKASEVETPKVETPKAEAPKAKVSQQDATPAAESTTSESELVVKQFREVATELWRQAKPVLQFLGTKALILGNRIADFLLDKAFPFTKEKTIQAMPEDFKTRAREKIDPVKEKVVPIWQKIWPWIQKILGPLWAKAIALIREKLPQELSEQLNDRCLNILLATTIYLVWSFFSGLTHPSQAKPSASKRVVPEVKSQPEKSAPVKTAPKAPAINPSSEQASKAAKKICQIRTAKNGPHKISRITA